MAKLSKAPPRSPIRPLRTAKPPPVLKTQDNYTHHTSPNKGPQPTAPEAVPAGRPGARLKTLPDVPMHKTKHSDDDA